MNPPAAPIRTVRRSLVDWRQLLARPPLPLLLGVVACIAFVRRPDMLFNPQFWAEDGWFYQRAYAEGFGSLLEIYAGYQHALPRIAALLAVNLEPRIAPALFVTFALGLTLYVAARTQSRRCPLGPSPLLALAVVCVPDAFEVLLVMANIQWVLTAGLVLLLISADAKEKRQHAHDIVAGLFLGLTGPFSIILAPLFLVRCWHRRSLASMLAAASVCTAGAFQIYCIIHTGLPTEPSPISPIAIAAAPGFRIAGSLLMGTLSPTRATPLLGLAFTALTVVALIAAGWLRSSGRETRLYIVASIAGLLVSSLYRCRYVASDLMSIGFGARYFFPIQLLVLWAMIDLWQRSTQRLARFWAALLLWVALVNVTRLREPALIDQHWASYAERIRTGAALVVPINPEGWTMTLPERATSIPSFTPAQFENGTPAKP